MGKWYRGSLADLFSHCKINEVVEIGKSGGQTAESNRNQILLDRSRTPCLVLGMGGSSPQDDLWRLMPPMDPYYIQGGRDCGVLVSTTVDLLASVVNQNMDDFNKTRATFRCLYPAVIDQNPSPAGFSMLAFKKYIVPCPYEIIAWSEQPVAEGQLQVKFEPGKIRYRFMRFDERTRSSRLVEGFLDNRRSNRHCSSFLKTLTKMEDIQGDTVYQGRFLLDLLGSDVPLSVQEIKNQVVIAHLNNLDKLASLYLSDELARFFGYRTDNLVKVTDTDATSFFNELLQDKLNNADLATILAPLFNQGVVDMTYYELLFSVNMDLNDSDFAAAFRDYAALYKSFSTFPEDSELRRQLVELVPDLKKAAKMSHASYRVEFRDTDLPYRDELSKTLKNIDEHQLNMKTIYVYPSKGKYYAVNFTHNATLVQLELTKEEYSALKKMTPEEQLSWFRSKKDDNFLSDRSSREPFDQALAQLNERMQELSSSLAVNEYADLLKQLTRLEEASQTYPENSEARKEASAVIAKLHTILASYLSVDGLTDKSTLEKLDLAKDYAEQFKLKVWVAAPSLEKYTAYFSAYPQLRGLLQDLEQLAGSFAEGSIPVNLAKHLIASVREKLREIEAYTGLNEDSNLEDYTRKGEEHLAFYHENFAQKGILECYREIALLERLYKDHQNDFAGFTPQSIQARHAQSTLADLAKDIQEYYETARVLSTSINQQGVRAFVDACDASRQQFQMQLVKLEQYKVYQDKQTELVQTLNAIKEKANKLPEASSAGKVMRHLARFLDNNLQAYQQSYSNWTNKNDQDTLKNLDFYYQQSLEALKKLGEELKVYDQFIAMAEGLKQFSTDSENLNGNAKQVASQCGEQLTLKFNQLFDQSYVDYQAFVGYDIKAIDQKNKPELKGVFYRNQIFFTVIKNKLELYIYDDYSKLHRLSLEDKEFGKNGFDDYSEDKLLQVIDRKLPNLRPEVRDKALPGKGALIRACKAEIRTAKEGLTPYPRLQHILDKIKDLLDSFRKFAPRLTDSLAKNSLFAKPKPVEDLTGIENRLNRFTR